MLPLVSIALPVFNAEKTLATAIRSIIFQTYYNWELIIVDDGSTDNSLLVAQSFKDPRIILLSDGKNKGISSRLNQALDLCEGEYFARMDADDISFPNRIESQVHYMNEHSNVDLLGTGILIYSGDGVPQGTIPIREKHEDICRRPWSGFYLVHPTWLGRTEWFLKHRYRSFADKAEDQDLLFRTHRSSCFACLSEVLLAYREEPRSFKKMLLARYAFLKAVFHEAMRTKNYYIMFRLFLLQPAKLVGDLLNIKFGFKSSRNPVLSPTPLLLKNWEQIWIMTK